MKGLIAMALAGAVGLPVLVGCESSGDKPYSLTGGEDRQMTHGERLRYTDQKGHYRPEYAARREEIRPMPRKQE